MKPDYVRFRTLNGWWIVGLVSLFLYVPGTSIAFQQATTNRPGFAARNTGAVDSTRISPAMVGSSERQSESSNRDLNPEFRTAGTDRQEQLTDFEDQLVGGFADQAERMAQDVAMEGSVIRSALTLAAVGLVPLLLVTTTCFVRLFVVLGLLRQAIGAQQLPSNQVIWALSFFVTALVMTPVWQEVKTQAVDPACRSDGSFDWQFAARQGLQPIKAFMTRQIEATGNVEAIMVFYRYQRFGGDIEEELPAELSHVPLPVLLPAFLISELKVAFLLGFQIYLPFLILDLVVSTLTVSMGMVMLPPSMVSLPMKLILFVMVDGWNLVIGMLLQSVIPPS